MSSEAHSSVHYLQFQTDVKDIINFIILSLQYDVSPIIKKKKFIYSFIMF
jgi:hypothetical protein